MTLIIIFFAIGITLLVFEVVIPGAVLGILGALAMIGGCIAAFSSYGFAGGMITSGIAMILIGVTLYIELSWLPRSRFVKRFVADATADGVSRSPVANADEVMGKEAVAETALAPSGYVIIGQRRFEASSESGFVSVGDKLRVVGMDNFGLIVTKITDTSPTQPTST